MDLYRILHPIWLAKGSHQPGFGNGVRNERGCGHGAHMPRDCELVPEQ
jgi:hypothetical protein